MEKISGIVKTSPRLSSVDLKEAAPVRPGVPAFGRPEGISTLTQQQQSLGMNASLATTAQKSAGVQAQVLDWRAKDAQNAAIAAEMSNRFFLKNTTTAETVQPGETQALGPMHMAGVSSKPAGFKSDAMFKVGPSVFAPIADENVAESEGASEVVLQQPEGLYPKGSFVDRNA